MGDGVQRGGARNKVESASPPPTESNIQVATLRTDVKYEHLELVQSALCSTYADLAMADEATCNDKVISVFLDTRARDNVINLHS